MKRIWRIVVEYATVLLAMAVASSITGAQQRPAPKHYAFDARDYWTSGAAYALNVTEYRQPFIYSLWWREIADCEGFTPPDSARQASVQFFVVPSRDFILDTPVFGSMLAVSLLDEPSAYIGSPYVYDKEIVMHEFLHYLLWWNGYRERESHPLPFFDRCGVHQFGKIHD